jgi:mono/diheme cytochrome c family protein
VHHRAVANRVENEMMKPLPVTLGVAAVLWAGQAVAEPAFAGADMALGERLIRENHCTQCHAEKVGGDGSAIYRPAGRINTPAALRAMVERCGTQLGLSLFPEELASIAAVLNRDHYHFK